MKRLKNDPNLDFVLVFFSHIRAFSVLIHDRKYPNLQNKIVPQLERLCQWAQ